MIKNKVVPVKLEPVELDGMTFHVPVLGVAAQRKIMFKLSRLAGEPLANLVNNQMAEDDDPEANAQKVSAMWEALASAFKSLRDPAVERVYCELLEEFRDRAEVDYVHTDSGGLAHAFLKHVYDEIFHCKLDLEARFLWACLEVNFLPFFERVKGQMTHVLGSSKEAGAEQPEQSDSEYQTASTGTSGV